jgi:hypothetical protein
MSQQYTFFSWKHHSETCALCCNSVDAPSLYTSDKLLLILLMSTLYKKPTSQMPAERGTLAASEVKKPEDLLQKIKRVALRPGSVAVSPERPREARCLSEPNPAVMEAVHRPASTVRRQSSISSMTVGKADDRTRLPDPCDIRAACSQEKLSRVVCRDAETEQQFDDVYGIVCKSPASGTVQTVADNDGLDYRRLIVFLQEGTWKHSPHAVHSIAVNSDITLFVVCEVSILPFFDVLANVMTEMSESSVRFVDFLQYVNDLS